MMSMFSDVPKDILTQLIPYIASHDILSVKVNHRVDGITPVLVVHYVTDTLVLFCDKQRLIREKEEFNKLISKVENSAFWFSRDSLFVFRKKSYVLILKYDTAEKHITIPNKFNSEIEKFLERINHMMLDKWK
jgi:hypothetical protein